MPALPNTEVHIAFTISLVPEPEAEQSKSEVGQLSVIKRLTKFPGYGAEALAATSSFTISVLEGALIGPVPNAAVGTPIIRSYKALASAVLSVLLNAAAVVAA